MYNLRMQVTCCHEEELKRPKSVKTRDFDRKDFTTNAFLGINLTDIYLLKVINRNTRTKCEICSKLTIKTPERRHWHRSGVFIVN